jgi:flagellum-specific peptidoglycan hydrolase FlgJ
MKEIITIEIGNDQKPGNNEPSKALATVPEVKKTTIKQFVSMIFDFFKNKETKDSSALLKLGIVVKKYRFSLAILGLVFMLIFRNDNTNATGLKIDNSKEISKNYGFDNGVVQSKESNEKKNKEAKQPASPKKATIKEKQDDEMKSFHIPNIPEVSKNRKPLTDLSKNSEKAIASYLIKYLKIAREESKSSKIPTSVILGLALMNSSYGLSKTATVANNHFDIKCNENSIPMGKGMKGQYVSNDYCFTHYNSAWASFRSNSNLINKALKKNPNIDKANANDLIKALDNSGYFDSRAFSAEQLSEFINENNLNRYDK